MSGIVTHRCFDDHSARIKRSNREVLPSGECELPQTPFNLGWRLSDYSRIKGGFPYAGRCFRVPGAAEEAGRENEEKRR